MACASRAQLFTRALGRTPILASEGPVAFAAPRFFSSYENYAEKSSTYTAMRQPAGIKHIAACFGPMAGKRILDSGCGTGNFAVALIRDYGVRKIHCSDLNKEMLQQARNNVETLCDERGIEDLDITFSNDNICDMPAIAANSFDFVINNQVVHHFLPDNDFAALRAAAKEWHRVLKPGGKLTVNFSTGQQEAIAMWWAELIPRAVEAWGKKAPTVDTMRSALENARFTSLRFDPLHDEILYDPDLYFNPRNFLDIDNFRRSDSTFNLCTDKELEEAVETFQKMVDHGTLDSWFQKKEQDRKRVGMTQTVYAEKSLH